MLYHDSCLHVEKTGIETFSLSSGGTKELRNSKEAYTLPLSLHILLNLFVSTDGPHGQYEKLKAGMNE